MNTIKVKTTQNVEVEYALASLGDRILASLIDLAVYFGWIIICSILISLIAAGQNQIFSFVISFVLLLPLLFYHLLCELFINGQSLGKKARDIKVIKLSGQAPSLGDYLLRWVFRLIDTGISYGLVALITVAINGKGQRLGDLAAGTSVIRTQPIKRANYFAVKTEEDYQVVFPEVHHLTDHDLALIRKLLYKALKYQNNVLLERLAQQTKTVMEVESNLPDEAFLRTVIKDYHYVMSGVEL